MLVVGAAVGIAVSFLIPRGVTPSAFEGTLENVTIGRESVTGPSGNVTFPIVSASLLLESPSSLDPQSLVITILGPNATMRTCHGSVPALALVFDSGTYPHWMDTVLSSGGGSDYCTDYWISFTDPGGGIVGGDFNASHATAVSIESDAIMTLGLPVWYASAVGFTVVLTYAGHPGALSLTVG